MKSSTVARSSIAVTAASAAALTNSDAVTVFSGPLSLSINDPGDTLFFDLDNGGGISSSFTSDADFIFTVDPDDVVSISTIGDAFIMGIETSELVFFDIEFGPVFGSGENAAFRFDAGVEISSFGQSNFPTVNSARLEGPEGGFFGPRLLSGEGVNFWEQTGDSGFIGLGVEGTFGNTFGFVEGTLGSLTITQTAGQTDPFSAPSFETSAVPEPDALLLVLGAAGVGLSRRRRPGQMAA